MNTYRIPVLFGRDKDDNWFAFSTDICWLAAEGESFDEVLNTLARIAPALVRQHGITLPFSFEWRAIQTRENALGGLS